MEKCLLLGNGGREAVMAEYLSKGYRVYAIVPYENPSIIEAVVNSKGSYIVGSPFDKELVKDFIQKEKIEVCVVSSDNLLREGLIDLAKSLGLKVFGPTSKGSKIEWSKTYALEVVEKLVPKMIIKNYNIENREILRKVVDTYADENFVIKPEGLTGGKGVKVGGIHFTSKEEGFTYAASCLEDSQKVIIQDKVEGSEFTVMCFTDGEHIVPMPITFDYPYRYEQDKGPGTGGMGCMSYADGLLPFLEQSDIDQCADLMRKTIQYLNKDAKEFTGVLYGGFFKTKEGIKFIEFNARFGDPEAINVLNALQTPFAQVVEHVAKGDLSEENCKFSKNDTFTVYVVSKDYAVRMNKEATIFQLNTKAIKEAGVKIYFANAKKVGENTYTSVSNSRLFAISMAGENWEELKKKIYDAIEQNVDNILDYRKDIGEIYIH